MVHWNLVWQMNVWDCTMRWWWWWYCCHLFLCALECATSLKISKLSCENLIDWHVLVDCVSGSSGANESSCLYKETQHIQTQCHASFRLRLYYDEAKDNNHTNWKWKVCVNVEFSVCAHRAEMLFMLTTRWNQVEQSTVQPTIPLKIKYAFISFNPDKTYDIHFVMAAAITNEYQTDNGNETSTMTM